MQKNSYLISKMFRNFLTATLLTSISTQIALFSDGIIVSNFIAPEALSAMNLTTPITSLMESIILFLCMGASVIAAKKIGAQQYGEASRVFSVALISGVLFFVVAAIFVTIFNRQIASFLCSDASIYPYLQSYLSVFVPAVVISVITICLQFFVSVDGKPHLVTKSVLVYAVGNILLDLVFITLLGWGMKGAVLATAVSQAASILILIPHFRDKTCSFHLVNPFKGFMSILKGNMKQGTPFLVSGICTSTCYLISNEIILNALGADGMFILSICMQITILLTFVIEGTGESILSIGAVLIGENDIDGLRTLVRKAFRFLNAGVFLFSAFIILFPTSLIHLFGAKSPELIGECIIPIRIFTCGLIFSINSRFLIFLYQLLGRMKASSLFPMLQMIFLLLFLWAGYMIAPELLWVAFPLTYFLLFLIQLLYARVASRKHKGMDRITLIPPVEDNLVFDRSVCYSKDDLDKALIEICDFMESQQVKMPDANKVVLCCEELMINLINYGKSRNDKQSFDIHIIRTKDAIKVSIKDDGKPFNPTLKYQETVSLDLTDEDVKQISLTIVNGTCEDINYKYMYGENMVYMNFQI